MDGTAGWIEKSADRHAGTAGDWIRDGWRIFRLAPLAVFAIAAAPLLAEALVQMVPTVGVVVSKLTTPLVSAWALALVHHKARCGAFAPRATARLCVGRLKTLARFAVLAAGIFAVQVLVAAALVGVDQAIALALGNMDGLRMTRAELALVLASGTLPGLALMFVLPRMLFDGLGARSALRDNARSVRRHWRPVLAINALATLATAAVLWQPLVLVALLPLHLCIGYAAYRHVYASTAR